MIDIIPLTVTSIKIVGPELNTTLQDASRHFEAFMADRNAKDQLTESKSCMESIVGILKMLNLPGANLLAEEMVSLLDKIISNPDQTQDFALSALSQAFVAMPCYIEYVVDREQAIPALTLSFVNELKAANRSPVVLESECAQYAAPEALSISGGNDKAGDLPDLIKRQRQLYQVGLIGLLREENLELKMQLMHRALSRIKDSCGSGAIYTQWHLAEAVLEAMLCGDLQLTFTRKRVLSLIDGALRQYAQSPESDEFSADERLMTELVYLVNLAQCTHSTSQAAISALGLSAMPITDKMLQRERNVMQGPNADTILTMVKALREELAQSKEILEIAAQGSSGSADFGTLVSLFQRTADILSVVGLTSASQILSSMKESIDSWAKGKEYSRDELLQVADSLLYVESTLSNLSRLDLDFSDIEKDDDAKFALMAKSQLDEAEAIVIKEAQAGIAQAKKDINSFIESNFDAANISTVVETLVTVKGSVAVLNLSKAASVLGSCIRFVESIISDGVAEDNAENILATMADALIALEYYLSEVELHGEAHPSVLAVAEQSLSALGFPVDA